MAGPTSLSLVVQLALTILFVSILHLAGASKSSNLEKDNKNHKKINKKYFFSVLLVEHNHKREILPFIQHYLSEGADHVYIYDTAHSKGTFDAIKCLNSQYYTVFERDMFHNHGAPSFSPYTAVYEAISAETEWLTVAGTHEFISGVAKPLMPMRSMLEEEFKSCGIVSIPMPQLRAERDLKSGKNISLVSNRMVFKTKKVLYFSQDYAHFQTVGTVCLAHSNASSACASKLFVDGKSEAGTDFHRQLEYAAKPAPAVDYSVVATEAETEAELGQAKRRRAGTTPVKAKAGDELQVVIPQVEDQQGGNTSDTDTDSGPVYQSSCLKETRFVTTESLPTTTLMGEEVPELMLAVFRHDFPSRRPTHPLELKSQWAMASCNATMRLHAKLDAEAKAAAAARVAAAKAAAVASASAAKGQLGNAYVGKIQPGKVQAGKAQSGKAHPGKPHPGSGQAGDAIAHNATVGNTKANAKALAGTSGASSSGGDEQHPKRIADRPFYINFGLPQTSEEVMFKTMCKADIVSCRLGECCPMKFSYSKEQAKVNSLVRQLYACLDPTLALSRDVGKCDALNWQKAFRVSTAEIGALTHTKFSGICSAPVPGIARHLLRLIPSRRPVKFILTQRDPANWAQSMNKTENLMVPLCLHDTKPITKRVSNPLGDYLECVEAARGNLKRARNLLLKDVFRRTEDATATELQAALDHFQRTYVFEVIGSYLLPRKEKLAFGRNLLLANFYNHTVNFRNTTQVMFDKAVLDYFV